MVAGPGQERSSAVDGPRCGAPAIGAGLGWYRHRYRHRAGRTRRVALTFRHSTLVMESSFHLPEESLLQAINQAYPCREAQVCALATLLHVREQLSSLTTLSNHQLSHVADGGAVQEPRHPWRRGHRKERRHRSGPRAARPRCRAAIRRRKLDRMHHRPTSPREGAGKGGGRIGMGE